MNEKRGLSLRSILCWIGKEINRDLFILRLKALYLRDSKHKRLEKDEILAPMHQITE